MRLQRVWSGTGRSFAKNARLTFLSMVASKTRLPLPTDPTSIHGIHPDSRITCDSILRRVRRSAGRSAYKIHAVKGEVHFGLGDATTRRMRGPSGLNSAACNIPPSKGISTGCGAGSGAASAAHATAKDASRTMADKKRMNLPGLMPLSKTAIHSIENYHAKNSHFITNRWV